MASERAAFVSIWERWDRVMGAMPKHAGQRYGERETNAMEDACQQLAGELGMNCSLMRSDLATARREGMTRPEALARVAEQP